MDNTGLSLEVSKIVVLPPDDALSPEKTRARALRGAYQLPPEGRARVNGPFVHSDFHTSGWHHTEPQEVSWEETEQMGLHES